MTQYVKNENKKTLLLSVTPRPFETSLCEIIPTRFPIPCCFSVVWTKPPPGCALIHATSDEPQLNPNFPLCSSRFNLKNHSQHPQGLIPLSFMKAEEGYIRTNLFPHRLFCLSWKSGAHQCAEARGIFILRVESPTDYSHASQGGPPISLFLLFLVFFPHSNHHYLDKLLTLPEKLNYINNSTMKILSPSEKRTAANKNLPDFHQATWAWILVMYECVVLPEVHPSVLSFSLFYICVYACIY